MCAIPDQTVNRQMRFTHQRTKSRRPTSGSLRTFIAYVPLSRRRFDCSRTLVSCISRKEQFQERFYKKDPTTSQGKSILSLFSIGKRNIGGGVGQRPNGSWRRTCRHERSAAYDCWSNLIVSKEGEEADQLLALHAVEEPDGELARVLACPSFCVARACQTRPCTFRTYC